MGKGTIISGGDDGQYTVRLEWGQDRLTAETSRLTARIAGYTAYIATLSEGKAKELAELEKSALERRLERVQAWQAGYTADERTVWCADLTEDLSGEVGTIEMPGEPTTVFIQPGYEGNAAYDSARDGQLEKPEAGTPAGVFWNWALMPTWQKYMPTHRTGTITAINGTLADITLDAATSSQQSLDVNQTATLSGVPFDYMSCDQDAFDVGDEVVVEFVNQDWNDPVVIGFKSNPQTCTTYLVLRCGGAAESERRYIVWNIERDQLEAIPGVSFPCAWSDIESWVSAKSAEADTSNIFTVGTGPSSDDPFESNTAALQRPFTSYSEDNSIHDATAWNREFPIAWGSCATGGPWEAETEECRVNWSNTTWNSLTGHTLKHYDTHWNKGQLWILSCNSDDWDTEEVDPWDTAHTYISYETRARYIEGSTQAAGTNPLNSANDSGIDGYIFTTMFEEMAVSFERYLHLNVPGPLGVDCSTGAMTWNEALEYADAAYADPEGSRDNDKTISDKYRFTTHLGAFGTLTGAQTNGPTYAAQSDVGRLEGSDQKVVATLCCPSAAVQIYVYQALTESYSGGAWLTDNHHIFIQASADMCPDDDGKSADPTAATVSEDLEAAIEDLIEAYYTAKGYSQDQLLNISLDISFYR